MGKIWDAWHFLEEYDIIIALETWVEKQREDGVIRKLKNSHKWWAKAAIKEKTRGRASGGTLVGIKKGLFEKCSVMEWDLGIIIKMKEVGVEEKVWLVSVYNNVGFKEVQKSLGSKVEEAIVEGARVIIAGDLNARIGEAHAAVDDDGEDDGWAAGLRKSEDKTINAEGRRLLKFCELYGLAVLNGRTRGDEEGKLTYAGGGGSSVLDLVMVAESRSEELIVELKVIPRIESDHLPVVFHIAAERGFKEEQNTGDNKERVAPPEKIAWKDEMADQFGMELERIWEDKRARAEKEGDWEVLKEAVWSAAEKTGMVKKERRGGNSGGWLDPKYKEQRKKVWKRLKEFLKDKESEKRKELIIERKKLREIYKANKKDWWEKKWKRIKDSRTMGEWWKAIGDFRMKKCQKGKNISKRQWVEHFSKLLGVKVDGQGQEEKDWTQYEEEVENSVIDPTMDADITLTEVNNALKWSKRRKAAGEDGIVVECLKVLSEEGRARLSKVLREIWDCGKLPTGWEKARIYPIHKAGDENEAVNYRGVSLLDIGYKLLTSIMARRMNDWIEKKKVLRESQAGFRMKRGTRDHVFVLNSIINNRLKKKGGKLYVAFVDFSAAFDKVDRDLLLRKLWDKGVRGKMHKMVRGIYSKTRNEVIAGEGMSEAFGTECGVRQGCPLSPILFNLFLDDIDENWEKRKEGGTVMGKGKFYALKYADDIAVLAETAGELTKMLKSLERFVDGCKMEVNATKTKIMVFRRGGKRPRGEEWQFKKQNIEVVKEFKYLGFWFSTGSTLQKHLRILAGKAQKAANTVWGLMKRARLHRLNERLYLFDSLAKAGALYGVEIWGWRKRSEMERVQARCVKMAMGLAKNTPDYIWKMEAGRRSVAVEARRRAGRYLLEIVKMGNARWPKICLREEIRGIINGNPSKWGKELKEAMEEVGDGRVIDHIWKRGGEKMLETLLEEGLGKKKDQDIQEDWTRIDKSSYCTIFKSIKFNTERESYWNIAELSGSVKETWARLRCGNIGRAEKKGYNDWSCRVCGQSEEDMEHIWDCQEAKKKIKKEWVTWVEKWKGDRQGESLRYWLCQWLRGPPSVEICKYVAEFEGLTKRAEEGRGNSII